ncbi:MAG: phosphatase PAP2 family protein [Acidobacteria bacterium]|nr:phosphatase PAP2 family protein [Acidobacteriota bacterium]
MTASYSRHGAARRVLVWVLTTIVLGTTAGTARADVVTDWNLVTFATAPGPQQLRALAMVHLAMFDAVNSIERRYTAYLSMPDAAPGTSAEAAAAGAAYGVLVRLYPASVVALNAALDASLATVPDGPSEAAGVALGDQVAAAIYVERQGDNMLSPNPQYVPLPGPGKYQFTPNATNTGNITNTVNIAAATWRPFALSSVDQFRADGPRPLWHPRYWLEVTEVRLIGGATSTFRTAEQSLIAQWHVEQGIPAYNRVARAEGPAAGQTLIDSARMFALLNLAMVDAVTSVFETKYVYNYWRPVTAIRQAGTDGNPFTHPDPTWLPLLTTPPHPEYPSAHSVVSMAANQVMEHVFGRRYAFTTTSAAVPGVSRTFSSFYAYALDASLARLYGGIHFRSALQDGMRQGRQIGDWVLQHYLRSGS